MGSIDYNPDVEIVWLPGLYCRGNLAVILDIASFETKRFQ
jgi:hypothetical protein